MGEAQVHKVADESKVRLCAGRYAPALLESPGGNNLPCVRAIDLLIKQRRDRRPRPLPEVILQGLVEILLVLHT